MAVVGDEGLVYLFGGGGATEGARDGNGCAYAGGDAGALFLDGFVGSGDGVGKSSPRCARGLSA